MNGIRTRLWALLLAAGMALTLLPGAALAEEPAPPADPVYEYRAVNSPAELVDGGTYVIVAPNSDHSVLYHDAASEGMSDQVRSVIRDGKLTLTVTAEHTEAAQTWTFTQAGDGWEISSADDGHHLNFIGASTDTDKVPVNGSQQVLTLTKNPDSAGWSVSAVMEGTAYYLHHNDSGHFQVSTLSEGEDPTWFSIYRKTEVVTQPLTAIDGYTQVTSMDQLTLGYYLIVAPYAGDYYVLYPGGIGLGAGVDNARKLILDETGKATGLTTPGGTDQTDALSAAHNVISLNASGTTYSVLAQRGSAIYSLFSGREVYGNGGTSSVAVTCDAGGAFRLCTPGEENHYLLYLAARQNFDQSKDPDDVGQQPDLLLFKSDTPVDPDDVPDPTSEATLTIPGYERRKLTANLVVGGEYIFVARGSNGRFYALYPNPEAQTLVSGDAIGDDRAKVVAQLTLNADRTAVTAARLLDDAGHTEAVDMSALHWEVKRSAGTFTIRFKNGLYLAMLDGSFLTDAPQELNIVTDSTGTYEGEFLVKDLHSGGSNSRILDFNREGDPNQYHRGDQTFHTNFWGPRIKHFPVFIYEYTGTANRPEKDKLQAVIDDVTDPEPIEGDYTPRSWRNFAAALAEARQVHDDPLSTEAQFLAARVALREAESELVPTAKVRELNTLIPAASALTGQNLRSPSLVTLTHQSDDAKNGRLAAAADIRWDHAGDACSPDLLFGYSDDDGATWSTSFLSYFGDGVDSKQYYAAAIVNPVMVETPDGALCLMADLWPGGVGVNTVEADRRPASSGGFVDVNGTQRLAVYTSTENVDQAEDNYAYYVGDFGADGFAPLCLPDGTESNFYVDGKYYLYEHADGGDRSTPDQDIMHCRRLGDTDGGYLHQNLFFYNAKFHIRNASYLLMFRSEDGGESWSAPVLLDPAVENTGTASGRGAVSGDETLLLPAYTYNAARSAGLVTSTDNGAAWTPGTATGAAGATAPVVVGNTLYLFTGTGDYYASADGGGTWTGPTTSGVLCGPGARVSAIPYSRQIDGKDAILLSASAGEGQTEGTLSLLLVNEDKTLTPRAQYVVADGFFGASCLTELQNGDVALLYESADRPYALSFVTLPGAKTDVELQVNGADGAGRTADFSVPTGSTVTYLGDETVVTAQVTEARAEAAQGNSGVDAAFTGETVTLDRALFTFTADGRGYQVESAAQSGRYLNITGGGAGRPISATPAVITLSRGSDAGSFYLSDGKFLYFHRDAKLRFDRNSSAAAACSMLLYRPVADGETGSAELPGYVQVTDVSDVQSGGQYLIAALSGGVYYVLNPSDSDNHYAYVIRVNNILATTLTLTAQAVGETDVVVGDALYHVTVTDAGSDAPVDPPVDPVDPPVDPVDPPVTPVKPPVTPAPQGWAGCPKDATCPIARYPDADPRAWYHDGLHYCVDEGLVRGYSPEELAPNDGMTRAMVAQLLYNKAGCPEPAGAAPFTDVAAEDWYAAAVAWAAEEGIVEGYGDGRFGPQDRVTREQLTALLWRYAGKPRPQGTLDGYGDAAAVSDWATDALRWAVGAGIVNGKDAHTLDPQGTGTRAEAASVLLRLVRWQA